MISFVRRAIARLNDPRDRQAIVFVASCLLLADFALSSLIVAKVPYTEIDWTAYMEEVHGYISGERNYENLGGGTGPLVYPAGFVYVYSALYWLVGGLVRGTSAAGIGVAQRVFVLVYIANQAAVFAVYAACEVIPPWAFAVLCASKRIHSVFVLRMFNDGVAMALAYCAVALYQRRRWTLGSIVLSLGISVKMNVLLMMPGLLVLLVGGTSVGKSMQALGALVATQIVLGAPFLLTYPKEYVSRAFELGRVFSHKWTVNFKFVPEDVFVSGAFAKYLLLAHLFVLLALAHQKWCRHYGGFFFAFVGNFFKRALGGNLDGVQNTYTPAHVALVLFESNFVGIVFARSLHYQFYSWYYHTLPLLLWSANRVPVAVKLAILVIIEWCWNVYPSTPTSSGIFVAVHLFTLAFVCAGYADKQASKKKSS